MILERQHKQRKINPKKKVKVLHLLKKNLLHQKNLVKNHLEKMLNMKKKLIMPQNKKNLFQSECKRVIKKKKMKKNKLQSRIKDHKLLREDQKMSNKMMKKMIFIVQGYEKNQILIKKAVLKLKKN